MLTILIGFSSCCNIEGSNKNIWVVYVAAYGVLSIMLTRFTSLSSTCSTTLIGSSMMPIYWPMRNKFTYSLLFLFPFSQNLVRVNNHATFINDFLAFNISYHLRFLFRDEICRKNHLQSLIMKGYDLPKRWSMICN